MQTIDVCMCVQVFNVYTSVGRDITFYNGVRTWCRMREIEIAEYMVKVT